MSKEQFKAILQSFSIKVNTANLPLALNDYSTHLNLMFEEKDEKIKDLEAKLAESDKIEDGEFWFEMWQHIKRDYDSVYKAYIKNCAEVDQLKYQIEKKKKKIKQLKLNLGMFKSVNEFINGYGIEKARKVLLQSEKTKKQDKISFAIEQLEKVKEFFLEEHRDEEMDTDYIITKDAGQIADYLLNQIKQLKGE